VGLHLFHGRKIQPKNYHGIFNFLSEDEKVLRESQSGWQVIFHSGKFKWHHGAKFRFGSLRKLLLTDKRLVLLKDLGPRDQEKEIDYEISVDDVESVEEKWAGGPFSPWFPYLKMELRNGKTVSLTFLLVSEKAHPQEKLGSYLLYGGWRLAIDTRRTIAQWVDSIGSLIPSRENRGS
jgi:hypothetical protein